MIAMYLLVLAYCKHNHRNISQQKLVLSWNEISQQYVQYIGQRRFDIYIKINDFRLLKKYLARAICLRSSL